MNIRKQEYLDNFDIALSSMWNHTPVGKTARMTNEKIIKIRQDCMEMSYYKYGPVRDNYIINDCMHPIEDMIARINKYENCHNSEYLIDAMNYCMLMYWKKTTGVHKIENMTDFINKTTLDFRCKSSICLTIEDTMRNYKKTDNLDFVIKAATLILWELKYPHYDDVFYKGTDNETIKPDGFCINEIRNFNK